MIVHIKPDIVAKFGEKIITGSMIKLDLNLVSKNIIIFFLNIDLETHKHTIRTCGVRYDVTRHCMYAHTLQTLQDHVLRL